MNSTVWKEKLSAIRDSFSVSIAKTPAEAPEAIELHYLGRKGELALLLRDLKDIPIEERKTLGALGNTVKEEMTAKLAELKGASGAAGPAVKADIDLTLPGWPFPKGSLHPLTHTMNRLAEGFLKLGFTMADGPLVEDDYHNFESLNFPPFHPARDMQDTFSWALSTRPQGTCCALNPGAGTHHGEAGSAAACVPRRPRLPFRGGRCQPFFPFHQIEVFTSTRA